MKMAKHFITPRAMVRNVMAISAITLLTFSLQAQTLAAEPSAWGPQRFEGNGVAVELSIKPVDAVGTGLAAGDQAQASITIRDARSGLALSGLRPKAWFAARQSEQVARETECSAKVKNFNGGQLALRPEADLNSYHFLTLNHDKTIAFINPQISWNRTKLESMVVLPAQGLDWALTMDQRLLYVSMPDASALAVIDTAQRKIIRSISTGAESRPTRLTVSPADQSVWVGLDGSDKLAMISGTSVNYMTVGRGLHQLAFSADGKELYVTNTDDNTVTVIDATRREKIADITVGNTPLKPVWSSARRAMYVSAVKDGRVDALSGGKLTATVSLHRGTMDLAIDPSGRFVFALNPLLSRVDVIDTAIDTVIAFAAVVDRPDQISFTPRFAYVRGIGSEKFSLLDLGEVARIAANGPQHSPQKLSVTDIQAGRLAPSAEPKEIGVAAMIVPVPEKNGVLVANGPDKTIYYYVEGMMAPMGTLQNYRRIPRGIMVLDRSLSEVLPGVYSALMTLPRQGNYDVSLLLDQPRMVHCFTVAIQANANAALAEKPLNKIRVYPLFDVDQPAAGEFASIRFGLFDEKGQPVTGLTDARLLAFEPPGLWQQRNWLKETSPGIYVTDLNFPHGGTFKLVVNAESVTERLTASAFDITAANTRAATAITANAAAPGEVERE